MGRKGVGRLLAVALIGAPLLLTGCVVYPYGDYYGQGSVVYAAPPQPRVEAYGVAPYPGYLWIGGYWDWIGGRHEWVGGHWEAPRAGYRYVPHQWYRSGGGWRAATGHWERH